MPVTQDFFIGRDLGPDSPPTITQSIFSRFNFKSPESGSHEMNFTFRVFGDQGRRGFNFNKL